MEDDSNVQIKVKGQRKSKKKSEEPTEETQSVELEEHHEEIHEEQVEEHHEEEKPKKKTPAKKAVSKVTEDYDIDQGPDIVIHKRHKGAKPRKVIVITGDSDVDESDEELPYRAKPKIEVKKRQARAPSPEPAPAPKPKAAPKAAPPKKQNVGLIAGKPQVVDSGKGISQRYHEQATAKKAGFVVDEFIDRLLNL